MTARAPLPETERIARLRLARTDRVGPVTFKQLLDRFGTAERAVEALPDLLRRGGGHGHDLPPVADIEAEIEAGAAIGARLIVAALLRISSLAALVSSAAAPLYALLPLAALGLPAPAPIFVLAIFTGVLIWVRHHQNIGRLLKGTEPRIGAGKA